jgi:hypothetical protein
VAVREQSGEVVSALGVLLDTSAWIAFFSPAGHEALKRHVKAALDEARVSTCAVVQTELLVGARDRAAFSRLGKLLQSLPQIPIDDDVWSHAAALGFNMRKKGRSVPLSDLLIAEVCRSRSLELWHLDEHYETIRAHSQFATRSFLEPRNP